MITSAKLKLKPDGFGLTELLIGVAISMTVVLALAYFASKSKDRTADLTTTSSCYDISSSIITGIKAHDNSLVVRNWLQSSATNLAAAADVRDPFCNGVGARTPICDTFRLFANLVGTPFLDTSTHKNYQNIRSTFTWAQNLYNSRRQYGICRFPGLTLSSAELGALLPTQVRLPDWVQDYQLFIKDKGLDCGALSNSHRAQFEVRVTTRYADARTPAGSTDACTASTSISFVRDVEPPSLQIQQVQSGLGENLDPGDCTDHRTIQAIEASGGPGTLWQNVYIDLLANEPGTLLACRRAGSFEADPPNMFRNCPDMPVGGTMTMTPNDSTVSYNTPLQARMSMQNLPDRGQAMHIYEVKAIDVSGNESPLASTSFRVHTPRCIDRSLYCPNAEAANPPAFNFESIHVLPYDDCLNGVCPQGTYSHCDPVLAASICQGETFADACGLPRCTGQRPPSCVGADPSAIPCGEPVLGQCGMNCGTGTAGCVPPSPSPGPSPAGSPGPTATPSVPNWSGTWGPYQCTDRNADKSCSANQPGIPAGYTNYRLTLTVLAQRFDGNSFVSVVVNFRGGSSATYSASGSGAQLGPNEGASHVAVPAFPGPSVYNIQGNGSAPQLDMYLRVHDASVQVFWTVEATNP